MVNINTTIFRFINNLGKEFQFLNPIMVFIAEYLIYGLAGFMILLWLFGKDKVKNRVMLSCCMISFIGAEVIGKILGKIYYHNQPFAMLNAVNNLVPHEIDNSFPSNHTILIFSICSMFYLFNRNKKGILAMIVAILVGISRIWVGVHWPIDVLVGALVGVGYSVIIYKTIPRLNITKALVDKYNEVESDLLQSVGLAKKQ